MIYSIEWLAARILQDDPIKYIFFWGNMPKKDEVVGKFIFSQWYTKSFMVDGIEYKTAEHWMMKAILFGDEELRSKILNATKPGEVKSLGRQIRDFDEEKWKERRYDIVKMGNFHKFSQDEVLRSYLLSTGDRILVEASPIDCIWGVGLAQDDPAIIDPSNWKGLNLLGFALMEVRDKLRNEKSGT